MLDLSQPHVQRQHPGLSRNTKQPKILAVATQGDDSGDADRLRVLLSRLPYKMVPFDRDSKRKAFIELVKCLWRERPDLVVLEGTGLAGGLAAIIARLSGRTRYVVSSGDAVGPYVRKFHPIIGLAFSLYERILCRYCAGFIGWTPYLVGRALTFGAPRAMTAAGWAPFQRTEEELREARQITRKQLGIPQEAIVIGIAGSLSWNPRVGYCYGLELLKARQTTYRSDVHVLIVGDGDGRSVLEQLAGGDLGRRVHMTGRVRRDQVPDYLAAMDAASLPQSVDRVGSFRYTTKISEYMAVGLPIITGYLPLAYDFSTDSSWRLPGDTPWGETYIQALREWMNSISRSTLEEHRTMTPRLSFTFDKGQQVQRVQQFIIELLDSHIYLPTPQEEIIHQLNRDLVE